MLLASRLPLARPRAEPRPARTGTNPRPEQSARPHRSPPGLLQVSTWTQDSTGNKYIFSTFITQDKGQSFQKLSKREQTLDANGNVTESKIFDYASLSTPARTYTNTYETGTGYTSRYIRDRLKTSTVTGSTGSLTLATLVYDQYGAGISAKSDARQHALGEYLTLTTRGNLTSKSGYGGAGVSMGGFNSLGTAGNGSEGGVTTTATHTSTYNYAAPSQITTNSLTESASWNSFLGLSSETNANGATMGLNYDAYARPSNTTSHTGLTTYFAYTNSPYTKKSWQVLPGQGQVDRWSKTTYDGYGSPVLQEEGHGASTVVSLAETEYDQCACSPIGK